MSTQYCLFFSFKGGVGRTSAMMNTAQHLAKMKKRVMCIDLDLPAPGIDVFDRVEGAGKPSYNPTKFMYAQDNPDDAQNETIFRGGHIPLNCPELKTYIPKSPGGFLDFCKDYLLSSGKYELTPSNEEHKVIRKIDTSKNKSKTDFNPELLPKLYYPGKLKDRKINYNDVKDRDKYLFLLPKDETVEGDIIMMRVGNHDDADNFDKLLASIDVEDLDPGLSIPIKERTMRDQPEFVTYLKNEIEEKIRPDYVLVDGRPSMDPISRFAMTWFANCIVLAFNLNPWNLNGIIGVYDKLAKNSPCLKGTQNIILLASPIPEFAQRSDLYTDQFDRIEHEMSEASNSGYNRSSRPIEVPQTDVLLLRDVLICDIEPYHPACRAYKELAQLIVAGNHQDVKNAIDNALSRNSEAEKLIEFDQLERRYHRMNEAIANEHGKIYLRMGQEQKALLLFEQAWNIIDDQQRYDKQKQEGVHHVQIISPYVLDTAYQLVETIRIIATKSLDYIIKKGSFLGEKKKEIVESQLTALNEAIDILFRVKELEDNIEFEEITDQAFAPFIALEANIYFLIAQFFKEQNNPRYKEKMKSALAYFTKAIDLNHKNADYYYGRALVNLSLGTFDSSFNIEKSIEDFEAAAKNKNTFSAALQKAGQYYFSLAFQFKSKNGNIKHFPAFTEVPPFVEQFTLQRESNNDELFYENGSLDFVNGKHYLEKARLTLKDSVDKQQDAALSHFYLGLIKLLYTTILENKEEQKTEIENLYKVALGHFSDATLYRPSFAPAYLYSGLTQFLLNALYVDENPILCSIRFRQAFYKMEHFIQLNFEKLVSDRNIADKKLKNREPFYFDGEPGKDIDQIKDSITNDFYDFPLTLEKKSGFPSLIKILRPDKRDKVDEQFIDMIESKLS